MAISFREKNRDPSVLARLWYAMSAPQTLGWMLGTLGLLIALDWLIDEPGIRNFGRTVAIFAAGSLIAVVVELVRRRAYLGRAFNRLGLGQALHVPYFKHELTTLGRGLGSPGLLAAGLVTMVLVGVGVPLFAGLVSFFDQTATGEVVVGSSGQEEVEGMVRVGGAELRFHPGLRMQMLASGGRESAKLRVEDVTSGRTREFTATPNERTRMQGDYYSLGGWAADPSEKFVQLRLRTPSGADVRTIRLRRGASEELYDGSTVTLLETRDSYLDMLGPAALIELTDSTDAEESRKLWIFAEAPDFDIYHGTGEHRFSFVGFQSASIPVLRFRTTAGIPWYLVCLVLVIGAGIAFLLRAAAGPTLTGRSGDYLVSVAGGWPFSGATGEPTRFQLAQWVTSPDGSASKADEEKRKKNARKSSERAPSSPVSEDELDPPYGVDA